MICSCLQNYVYNKPGLELCSISPIFTITDDDQSVKSLYNSGSLQLDHHQSHHLPLFDCERLSVTWCWSRVSCSSDFSMINVILMSSNANCELTNSIWQQQFLICNSFPVSSVISQNYTFMESSGLHWEIIHEKTLLLNASSGLCEKFGIFTPITFILRRTWCNLILHLTNF